MSSSIAGHALGKEDPNGKKVRLPNLPDLHSPNVGAEIDVVATNWTIGCCDVDELLKKRVAIRLLCFVVVILVMRRGNRH